MGESMYAKPGIVTRISKPGSDGWSLEFFSWIPRRQKKLGRAQKRIEDIMDD